MPKTLFYAGIVFCLLFAVFAAVGSLRQLVPSSDLAIWEKAAYAEISLESRRAILLLLLIAVVPVVAIFLRMAALLAARDLFSALLAVVMTSCAALSFTFLLLTWIERDNSIKLFSAMPGVLHGEMPATRIAWELFGWFFALSLLVLRPYFRVHASPLIATLVYLPTPLLLLTMLNPSGWESGVIQPGAEPAIAFRLAVATLLTLIALHSLRHRHLFIELTNLRELLDTPFDPGSPATARGIPFGNGIAFDS